VAFSASVSHFRKKYQNYLLMSHDIVHLFLHLCFFSVLTCRFVGVIYPVNMKIQDIIYD
jgi:hypothetical protein